MRGLVVVTVLLLVGVAVVVLFCITHSPRASDYSAFNATSTWWKKYSRRSQTESWPSFFSVNPLKVKRLFDLYIWTPKTVYTVDEEITLYIEHFCIAPIAEKLLYSVENPLLTQGPTLVVLKSDEGFLLLKNPLDDPSGNPVPNARFGGDYIPSKDEIDTSRLHGNLKMPRRELLGEVKVHLKKGDSFVVKINDLAGLFSESVKDIKGTYRVQYRWSNIIEFEIR